MVDETGLDEPKVDKTAVNEIAVDEPGAHQFDWYLKQNIRSCTETTNSYCLCSFDSYNTSADNSMLVNHKITTYQLSL